MGAAAGGGTPPPSLAHGKNVKKDACAWGRVSLYSFLARGHGSVGRAPPCQGGGRGFEPRCPLHEIEGPAARPALFIWRRGQVVRHGPAKPPPPVRIWASPPSTACGSGQSRSRFPCHPSHFLPQDLSHFLPDDVTHYRPPSLAGDTFPTGRSVTFWRPGLRRGADPAPSDSPSSSRPALHRWSASPQASPSCDAGWSRPCRPPRSACRPARHPTCALPLWVPCKGVRLSSHLP